MAETLYSEQDAFFLEIDTFDYKIREPIGWDKVKISLTRDKDEHGLTLSFPGKKVTLEFSNAPEEETGNNAKQLIDTKYLSGGPDSDIILKYGQWDGVTFTELTRQKLDLSDDTFVRSLYITKCQAVEVSFERRIRDYYQTPINTQQTEDLLGNAIVPLTEENIITHSKTLLRKFEGETILLDQTQSEGGWQFPDDNYYLQYGVNKTTLNDLLESFNVPNGLSNIDPLTVGRTIGRLIEGGELTIQDVKAKAFFRFFVVGLVQITVTSYIGTSSNLIQVGQTIFNEDGGLGSLIGKQFEHNLGSPESFLIAENDELFFYTHILFDQDIPIDRIIIFSDEFASFIDLTALTTFRPTVTLGNKLFESVSFVCDAITGISNSFRSTFYSGIEQGEAQDNAGRRYFITNALRLRGKNDSGLGATFSLQSAFESLRMFHSIGQAFEMDGVNEVIRWERADYFYQDHEIIDLSSRTSEFEYFVDSESSIAEVSMTYPRLSVREDSGSNTIDEFNSEIKVVSALEIAKKNIRIKAPWRASGYDIETARRLSKKDTESYKTDDDIHIIAYQPKQELSGIKMLFQKSSLLQQLVIYVREVDFDAYFKYANRMIISGSSGVGSQNANGTYDYDIGEISRIDIGTPLESHIRIAAETTDGYDSISLVEQSNLNIDFIYIRSERTEPFSVVSGILDADSSYNLRLHPLRIFVNWALLFNSAMWYKAASTLWKTQFKKENRDLVTQLDISDPHPLGDADRVVMTESVGIEKQDADRGKSLVQPNACRFKAELFNTDELQLIIDSYKGQGLTPYGYITTRDNDGNTVRVYVDEFSGLPNDNVYDIEGRLRGDYYD